MKPRLVVKMTLKKGRGVFTKCRIRKGEIIETASVIVLTDMEQRVLLNKPLGSHFYAWGPGGEQSAFVGGFGSFYNHSYRPNISYYHLNEDEQIVFKAIKNIQPGEELTHNYVVRGERVVFTETGWEVVKSKKRKK